MSTDYTLTEAAQLTGIPVNTLRQRAKRGTLPVLQIERNGKFEKGIKKETLECLLEVKKDNTYENLKAEFLNELRTVGLRGRPVGQRHIDDHTHYLDLYWQKLGGAPSIERLTPENLKLVFAQYVPNREKKLYYDTTRQHIYRAVASMATYLVSRGLKRQAWLLDIRNTKPRRVSKPHKPTPELDDVRTSLRMNDNWSSGRSEYDIALLDILVSLYVFAGLRKFEATELKTDGIIKDGKLLHVYGKRCKERFVPIFPELKQHLENWLEIRPKSDWLVPMRDGSKLTLLTIENKFKRFNLHMKKRDKPISLQAHGLRRAFATVAALNGMSLPLIQLALGHEDQGTTQGYLMIKEQHLIDFVDKNPLLFQAQDVRSHLKSI